MARKEKLLSKLLEQPKTFSYRELKTVLESIGFEEVPTGKTSGSAVAFYHRETEVMLNLHRPHPGDELKKYQIKKTVAVIKKVIDTYADEDD